MKETVRDFIRRAIAIVATATMVSLSHDAFGQLGISNTGTSYLIDFSTTITGVNNGAINGTGFSPTPTTGQLDSDAWAATGMDSGTLVYGGTQTTASTDFTRGSTFGTTGGFFGLTVSGNSFLALRPGGSDWTPGTLTLRLQNNSGATITGFTTGYDIMALNDQGRSNSFNFSFSADNTTFTNVAALDYTSPTTATASPTWLAVARTTTLTNLTIANNDFFYLRWFGDDIGGSGSRDGFGLDNVLLSSFTSSAPPSGSPIYWDANGVTAGIGGTGTWSSASPLFSSAEAGTDPTTRAAVNPVAFGGTAGDVTISGGVTASAGLTFATTGYTLAGDAITLGGVDAAANTIVTSPAVAAVISSVISGSTGLTKGGNGSLTLGGANDYTGGTVVSAGSLIGTSTSLRGPVTNNAAVVFDQATSGSYAGNMAGTGSLTKSGPGALTLSGSNSYLGGTTVSAGSLIGTTASLQGAITNNAAVTFSQELSGTYAGSMAGSGSVTKAGAGAVTLSGTSTHSGGTTISAGSLVGTTSSLQGAIVNDAAIVFDQATNGTYAGSMSGSGSLSKSGAGVVTLSGSNSYSGGTTVSAGAIRGTTASLQGAITNNATVSFSQDTPGTYAGALSGSGLVTKSGTGSVTFSGNNSYAGGTMISAGTLVASGSAAFGTGAITASGGALDATNGALITNQLIANAASGGFIISEYVEGSSNNKYIELYNGTGATISLADYRLSLFGNGASVASTTFLLNNVGAGNTLGAGATVVIANSSAALTLPQGVTAYTTASGLTFYNGDDALALQLADGTNIDIFGRIGDDPGTAWTSGTISTLDQTLVRNPNVVTGVSVNPSGTGTSGFATLGTEWTSYPIDTVSNLGSHTMNAGGPGSVTIGSTVADASVTYSGGLTLTSNAALSAATGGTTSFTGTISGAGSMSKVGEGTVILSGNNDFSGSTTISAGRLAVSSDANLGSASSGINLAGGTLVTTENFTLSVARIVTVSGTSGWDVAATKTVTFNGDFSGSGRLNKGGLGQLTLGGTSAGYTGTFAINAGTVELTNADALDNAIILQTGGALILAPSSGTNVPLPGLQGNGGEVSIGNGRQVAVGDNSDRSYGGRIRGQGGFKKQGTGRLELTGNNDYSGTTLVNSGRLVVNGSLSQTPLVTVASGAEIGGSGSIGGTLAGAGAVGPGNSPGIFSAPNTDPSGGLDYNFEFTGLTPDYANAAASVNDVLRLTDTTTPFLSSLGASNAVKIYLPSSVAEGQTYVGGFFLDATTAQFGTFLGSIASATFSYFVQDNAGGVTYEGLTYRTLGDWNNANGRSLSVTVGTSNVASAAFVGGTVTNGQSMQMVIVPEPSAFALAGLGAALAGYAAWKRRRPV